MPTILECAYLAKLSYTMAGASDAQPAAGTLGGQAQTAHHGWTLVNHVDNPHPHRAFGSHRTGALVMQIWERHGEYVVATRGTDPRNIHDLLSDLQIGLHSHFRVPLPPLSPRHSSIALMPKHHTRGVRAFGALQAWDRDQPVPEGNITFTGHSLGGNLAQLLALKYEKKDCLFVTFNSPGSHERRSDHFGINVCLDKDLVRRTGGKNLGVKYLMRSDFGRFSAHGMDNLISVLRNDPIAHKTVRQAIHFAKDSANQIDDPNDRFRMPWHRRQGADA